ncbi:conserved hypothetical protein [Ricinus communis]|uniref:Epidermal patterning factor-like protein n=1 Tax=Ricinus communis TaxID=3988 RepID=B9SNE3_RICCO|nr:conserved hypothetical protein [Ricinus communis]
MVKRTSMATILLTVLLFITLTHSSLVHSRELAHSDHSPSPAPMVGGEIAKRRGDGRAKKGSFPARCHSKCNQCNPCLPVEVSIRSMELKEKEYYYPQVWKCMCGDDIFSP